MAALNLNLGQRWAQPSRCSPWRSIIVFCRSMNVDGSWLAMIGSRTDSLWAAALPRGLILVALVWLGRVAASADSTGDAATADSATLHFTNGDFVAGRLL